MPTSSPGTRSSSRDPVALRVAPDGAVRLDDVFVTGHSYADGGFSTATTLVDTPPARRSATSSSSRSCATGAVPGARLQLLGRHVRPRRQPLLRHAGHGRQDVLVEGDVAARQMTRAARGRRVPVAVAGQHAARLQAADQRAADRVPGGWRARPGDLQDRPLRSRRATSTTRSSGWTTATSCTRCPTRARRRRSPPTSGRRRSIRTRPPSVLALRVLTLSQALVLFEDEVIEVGVPSRRCW